MSVRVSRPVRRKVVAAPAKTAVAEAIEFTRARVLKRNRNSQGEEPTVSFPTCAVGRPASTARCRIPGTFLCGLPPPLNHAHARQTGLIVAAGAKVGFSGPGLERAGVVVACLPASFAKPVPAEKRTDPAPLGAPDPITPPKRERQFPGLLPRFGSRRLGCCDGRGFFSCRKQLARHPKRRLVASLFFSAAGDSTSARRSGWGAWRGEPGGVLFVVRQFLRDALRTSVRRANCPVVVGAACFSRHALLSPPVSPIKRARRVPRLRSVSGRRR